MRRIFSRNLDSEDLQNIRRRGKKNKPKNTPFLQQKLVGYRPLLTLRVGLVIIAILEVLLVVSGCLLFLYINEAKEHIIDYTNCTKLNSTDNSNFYGYFSNGVFSKLEETENNGNGNITCYYNINLTTIFNGSVRFYYGLDNYYQNMRLYFRSRNDEQLQGKDLTIVEDCQPYKHVKNKNGTKVPIAPCGAVANSFFNDTFLLFFHDNDTLIPVPWTTAGLIGKNVKTKYQNPEVMDGQLLRDKFNNTVKPTNWTKNIWELDDGEGGVGFENFDFMIWMQTAALPHFRKIYRQLDTGNDIFHDGLPNGTYQLQIHYNYPVMDFNGKKLFIIAIESAMGTKNYFLPTVYLATAVALFFATVFLIVVEFCPCAGLDRKLRTVARHF